MRVKRGERRRYGCLDGSHAPRRVPEPDAVSGEIHDRAQASAWPKTLTLVAKLKDDKESFAIEAGNGVENSWSGYFSQGARETSIVVDVERLVPLEEQTGGTTVRYSDWQDIGPGRSVPRRVDVLGPSAQFRMNLAWLGDAVWLLRNTESITPEATLVLTRTRNVIANGRHVSAPVTDAEKRSQDDVHGVVPLSLRFLHLTRLLLLNELSLAITLLRLADHILGHIEVGVIDQAILCLLVVEEVPGCGLLDDDQRAGDLEPAIPGLPGPLALVDEDPVGPQLSSQRDGRGLARAELNRRVELPRPLDGQPCGGRCGPAAHGLQLRAPGGPELLHHLGRRVDLTEDPGQDVDGLDEDEVSQRGRIGNRDHRALTSRRAAACARISSALTPGETL